MAKVKKYIHPNNKRLAELIEQYGAEAVASATAYSMSTILLYSKGHVGTIKAQRLENAVKLLEQK